MLEAEKGHQWESAYWLSPLGLCQPCAALPFCVTLFPTVILPKAWICSTQNKGKGVTSHSITQSLFFFQVGVQVFTKRPLEEEQNSFNPDDILTCLKKYPDALVKYLEHLVMDRKLQVSTAKLRLRCMGCGTSQRLNRQNSTIKPVSRWSLCDAFCLPGCSFCTCWWSAGQLTVCERGEE